MNVEIEELTPEVIGQKLGRNIYNANGNVLLREGVVINTSYYAHFSKQGYRSICLLGDDVVHLPSHSNFVPDRFIATAPFLLKEIFRMLWQEDNIRVAEAKAKLTSLAQSLLTQITLDVQKATPLLDLKRPKDYLYQHSINVAAYSLILGHRIGYDNSTLLALAQAALLHDFGMLFIDDEIVNKTTRLAKSEIQIVRQHTTKGFTHLFNYGPFDGISALPSAQHHERYDGRGYPQELSGEKIHEFSRIVALADGFDAWTSDRPHRRLHSTAETLKFIKENTASIFDPRLARLLIDLLE